jgi:hypothetical protein
LRSGGGTVVQDSACTGAPLLRHQLCGHEHDVTGVQFIPDQHSEDNEQSLLSVSRDGYMRKWSNLFSGDGGSSGSGGGGGEVACSRFSPAGGSSYTCLDSWKGLACDDRDGDGGRGSGSDSRQYLAMGDIRGSVQVVDSEGRLVHSTSPGVVMDS